MFTTTKLRKSLRNANFYDKVRTFSNEHAFCSYIKGLAYHTDRYTLAWQEMGFSHKEGIKSYHRSPQRLHKKKKSFLISDTGNYCDFYTGESGSFLDFLQQEKNFTTEKSLEWLAHLYGCYDYQIGKKDNFERQIYFNSSEKDKNNAALTYFRSRIYKELGLDKETATSYFSPALGQHKGISIAYTDIEGRTIFDKEKPFERIRLASPYKNKEGKTTKYLSPKGAATYPYLTALANAPITTQEQNTLFITEGEFKAFFGVQKLGLPFVGLGGISLTAQTDKNELGKTIYNSARFDDYLLKTIEKFGYKSIHLLFDADTFDNQSKENRHLQFFAAIKKAFIASQKLELEFTFSIINPLSNAKGLDDLSKNFTPLEIRKNLLQTTHHNPLFQHFRFDTKKSVNENLFLLQNAFLASQKVPKTPKTVKIIGFLGNQLLENEEFLNDLKTQEYTLLEAPTGIGKSYFVKHHLAEFAYEKGYTVLFASPRNVIAKQQAIDVQGENDKIVFTADTQTQAIERLKTEEQLDIVYTNFDKLADAYHILTQFHHKKVLLVIDEQHLITGDSTFRDKVITSVLDTLKLNPTNLLMSATPTQMYLFGEKISHWKVVAKDKAPYQKPSLIFCSDKKMKQFAFEKTKELVEQNQRVILHLNSLEQAKVVKNLLEKQKIGVHLFASQGLTPTQQENFEHIQRQSTFHWKDNKKVIITTSVLETGFNISTDRKTAMLYFNKTQRGFDNTAYRQFIARVRNYDEFEVENTIITQNSSYFLPSEHLVLSYDYKKRITFLENEKAHHNRQYLLQKELEGDVFVNYQKEELKTSMSKGLYFDREKEQFEISYTDVFADYTHNKNRQGSPYFENPKQILFYEQKVNNEISQLEQIKAAEREKAEGEIAYLFVNDFEKLIVSVEQHTSDVKLKSKLKNSFSEEATTLTPLQLLLAEQLLKHYLYLLRVQKIKNIRDFPTLKTILVDTQQLTFRKTNDLRKRKNQFTAYTLLLRREKEYRLGISESMQVKEYERIVETVSKLEGQTLTAEEITKQINRSQHQYKRYTKRKLLELLNLLCHLKRSAKVIEGKKTYYYTFEGKKDIQSALNELLEHFEEETTTNQKT